MAQVGASMTLTVFHDGQFWVGMFERVEGGRLSACRVVFGAEPSNEEVLRLVTDGWGRLAFTDGIEAEAPRTPGSPKRRQREASRALKGRGPSTKAQQALSEQMETSKAARRASARERREAERQERFEKRAEKRKRRHRGH